MELIDELEPVRRGPYAGAREYDLTAATARRLKFKGHGTILSTR